MFKAFGSMVVIFMILQAALLGGLIYLVFWLARHFALI